MTRKHFEALAASLKRTRPVGTFTGIDTDSAYTVGARDQWNYTVGGLVNVCSAANPAFSPSRFVQACGGYF